MGKEIKIIKKVDHKRFEDYTFTDNNKDTELRKTGKGMMIAIQHLLITKSIKKICSR